MNFISREYVLAIFADPSLSKVDCEMAIEALPMFPAPNPGWKKNNRNVLNDTQDQFWNKVEDQYPTPPHFKGTPEC